MLYNRQTDGLTDRQTDRQTGARVINKWGWGCIIMHLHRQYNHILLAPRIWIGHIGIGHIGIGHIGIGHIPCLLFFKHESEMFARTNINNIEEIIHIVLKISILKNENLRTDATLVSSAPRDPFQRPGN